MKAETKDKLKTTGMVVSILVGLMAILSPVVFFAWNMQHQFNQTVTDLRDDMAELRGSLHADMTKLRDSVHADMTKLRDSVHKDTTEILQRLTRVETIVERLDGAGPRNAENTQPKPAKPDLKEAKLDKPDPRNGATLLTSTAVD